MGFGLGLGVRGFGIGFVEEGYRGVERLKCVGFGVYVWGLKRLGLGVYIWGVGLKGLRVEGTKGILPSYFEAELPKPVRARLGFIVQGSGVQGIG